MIRILEMAVLAYNLSPKLEESLDKIDVLNKRILLASIPPKTEIRMAWETNLQRIYWSLSLTENTLSKPEVIRLLSGTGIRKLGRDQREVLNYKTALDYIKQEWLISKNPVTFATINRLFEIYSKRITLPGRGNTASIKKQLNYFLDYLQTANEHPIIQAGIAQIQMIELSHQTDGNGSLARLIPYLFLYKNGYHFRSLLVLDEYFRRDVVGLKTAIESVASNNNLTLWLEYFASALIAQLNVAINNIENTKFQTDLPASFWKLNDRQREIIILLEQPGVRISNKNVQKMFGVSQITASRDLAKLVSLGFLFSYGKGRSVYYTRV
jgi:Fic family protein